jgi:hypothetical protein
LCFVYKREIKGGKRGNYAKGLRRGGESSRRGILSRPILVSVNIKPQFDLYKNIWLKNFLFSHQRISRELVPEIRSQTAARTTFEESVIRFTAENDCSVDLEYSFHS